MFIIEEKSMNEIVSFLNRHKGGFLATVEDNMPRVRPWSFLIEDGGKFWFLTTKNKRVYQQLQNNPNVEFCSSSMEYVHIRLTGKIEFSENIEMKKRKFEEHIMLKQLYETHENPILVCFFMEHGTAAINSYHTGEIKFFEF